jgi:hypothetical protein
MDDGFSMLQLIWLQTISKYTWLYQITMLLERWVHRRWFVSTSINNYGAAYAQVKADPSILRRRPAAQIKELDGLWLADRCPE